MRIIKQKGGDKQPSAVSHFFHEQSGSLSFNSGFPLMPQSYLDRCVLIVWHLLTWINVKSFEPERFTFFTERNAFDRSGPLYISPGSQMVCEQHLTHAVFPVYAQLISLTNTVPLFYFSFRALQTLPGRYGSLSCVTGIHDLRCRHTGNLF